MKKKRKEIESTGDSIYEIGFFFLCVFHRISSSFFPMALIGSYGESQKKEKNWKYFSFFFYLPKNCSDDNNKKIDGRGGWKKKRNANGLDEDKKKRIDQSIKNKNVFPEKKGKKKRENTTECDVDNINNRRLLFFWYFFFVAVFFCLDYYHSAEWKIHKKKTWRTDAK